MSPKRHEESEGQGAYKAQAKHFKGKLLSYCLSAIKSDPNLGKPSRKHGPKFKPSATAVQFSLCLCVV